MSERRENSIPLAPLLWFAALLLLCYAPMLRALFHQWQSDDDMGHGMFVPVIAAYIAWSRRERLLEIAPKPNSWGLLLVVLASMQLCVASFAGELFLARTAVILAVIGTLLYLRGFETVRALAFPLALLLFMVPLPGIIYKQITFPLQLLASRIAESTLELAGITVLRDGNILEFSNLKLSVVEACSGIRSLLSLAFFSLAYSFFCDEKVWMRWVLLLGTVPIALIANASRIVVSGVAGRYSPELAEGVFHFVSSWIIFTAAVTIFLLTHKLVNRVYAHVKP
jgi:exosortase